MYSFNYTDINKSMQMKFIHDFAIIVEFTRFSFGTRTRHKNKIHFITLR